MAKTFLKPLSIPDGVSLTHEDLSLTAKGKLGELSLFIHPDVEIIISDGNPLGLRRRLTLTRAGNFLL